jgi:hypothetical protein
MACDGALRAARLLDLSGSELLSLSEHCNRPDATKKMPCARQCTAAALAGPFVGDCSARMLFTIFLFQQMLRSLQTKRRLRSG